MLSQDASSASQPRAPVPSGPARRHNVGSLDGPSVVGNLSGRPLAPDCLALQRSAEIIAIKQFKTSWRAPVGLHPAQCIGHDVGKWFHRVPPSSSCSTLMVITVVEMRDHRPKSTHYKTCLPQPLIGEGHLIGAAVDAAGLGYLLMMGLLPIGT